MTFPFGYTPSLNQLQQYRNINPNQQEAITQTLYDTVTYQAAGQTQLSFFQVPLGSSGKTNSQTNMSVAGMLPNPIHFLVTSLQLLFFPSALPGTLGAQAVPNFVNDVYKFGKGGNGNLVFTLSQKPYLTEAPLCKFPPLNGMKGIAAVSDSTTAGAAQQTMIEYATWAGEPYQLPQPLLIESMVNFSVQLNWDTAVAISANASVQCILGGIQYRASQ